MKTFYITLAGILVASLITAQDNCLEALEVGVGMHQVDTVTGSQIPLPVCAQNGTGATAGMWYIYTPAENSYTTVTTSLFQNVGKDTRVHIYTGSCDGLVCVAGDDDSGFQLLSTVNFLALQGNAYYIAFDNRWDSRGFFFELSEAEYNEPPVTFSTQTISLEGSKYCVVDMNGDYLDDIVSIEPTSVNVLLQTDGGAFEFVAMPTPTAIYMPSWSIAAGDINADGLNDLLYGGGQGVSFMIRNEDGVSFSQVAGSQYVFSQRSNFIDINNDGHLDAFVCHDVQPNVYYINDGEGNLSYFQGGLGDTQGGGNYGSIWIDYDNDGDMDLFIAKCRGGNIPVSINQLHRNNGDGTFTEVADEAGLADPIQTWSSAWADFDNDGYLDVIVGASSFANGSHKLMRNNGDGTFTDITAGSGFQNYTPTTIEWIAHDFDNDGYVDIMGGGNSIMFNNGDMTFSRVQLGISNGPVGDLNNDGFLDVVNGNSVRFNDGNANNYLKFNVKGVVSNLNGIGARIEVYSAMGKQIREVRSGEGFRFMSTLNVHFGLGLDTEIDSVVVHWPAGGTDTWYEVEVNTTLTVVEGEGEIPDTTTDVKNPERRELLLFPNPATNEVYLTSNANIQNARIALFDLSGKVVMQRVLTQPTLDLSALPPGMYILQLEKDGMLLERKVVKR